MPDHSLLNKEEPLKESLQDNADIECKFLTQQEEGKKEPSRDVAGEIVLDYCSAVRGILNDDQGGPLYPPGLRMADALGEIRQSLQRNLDLKKNGCPWLDEAFSWMY